MYYVVTVTNGLVKYEMPIRKDGDWVKDVESAERMAQSKINNSWRVVEGETKELA
jgi:hypothetical protein